MDPELLDAFLPEFIAACASFEAAGTEEAARRALDQLRAMAGALGDPAIKTGVEDASLLLDPFMPEMLSEAAAMLRSRAEALVPPPAEEPPSPAAASSLPVTPARTRPVCRALVVDDSALMRRLVRETLDADPDFEVIAEAADGVEALHQMAALKPDLTMLDIEMPVLDGLGVLRAWSLTGPGAVIIVSSAARPGSTMAIEARRLGATSVVGKPSGAFSPDLRERQGDAIRRAARRAVGLPVEGAAR